MCGFSILTGERADMGAPFFPTCTCLYCLISEASSCPGLFRAHRSKFEHNDTLPDEGQLQCVVSYNTSSLARVVVGCQANHSPVTRTFCVATGIPKDEIKGNARTYCLNSSINILIIIVGVPVEAHRRRNLAVLLFPVRLYVYSLDLPFTPQLQSGPRTSLFCTYNQVLPPLRICIRTSNSNPGVFSFSL